MKIIESSIDSIFRSLISAAPRSVLPNQSHQILSDASFSSILDVYSSLSDTPRANREIGCPSGSAFADKLKIDNLG